MVTRVDHLAHNIGDLQAIPDGPFSRRFLKAIEQTQLIKGTDVTACERGGHLSLVVLSSCNSKAYVRASTFRAPLPQGFQMDNLRIYVIWAPDDAAGLPLAEVIARHFDNAGEARAFGGIRIPVFVRHASFAPESSAPRIIDLDAAEHNLIVAIGTHHLIDRLANDQAWATWFDGLSTGFARRDRKDRFVLLSLESGVLQVPVFPNRHAIRAFEWDDGPESSAFHTHLLLLLTNRCGSLLLEGSNPPAAGEVRRVPKQRLFISHAKQDGAADAVRIRKRLNKLDFGIEPFVDANDLTSGEIFSEELEAEIADATLLAIYTDAYSSRPFCRWEVLRAKFHRRPIYIVHRLKQGDSRVFPYGGNAPLMVVTDLGNDTIDKILLQHDDRSARPGVAAAGGGRYFAERPDERRSAGAHARIG
jgi:hypothetical protein